MIRIAAIVLLALTTLTACGGTVYSAADIAAMHEACRSMCEPNGVLYVFVPTFPGQQTPEGKYKVPGEGPVTCACNPPSGAPLPAEALPAGSSSTSP